MTIPTTTTPAAAFLTRAVVASSKARGRAAAAAAALLAACAGPMPHNPPVAVPMATPPAALHLEGVPAVARSLVDAIARYSAVVGHGFVDWHPQRREMLVSYRAPGESTAQLFLLRAPMARPEPLTDGADPVTRARWEPREGRYIVFERGRGGDEAYQLFRLDPATRAVTQITPDGQRHALAAWLPARSLAVVASVPLDRTSAEGRRAEITTTLWLVDPMQPASRRELTVLPGGGWFEAKVAPDERRLAITRYTSATESEVWLIDMESGARTRLLPAALDPAPARARHHVGEWSRDGRALYVVSDRSSEFSELLRVDVAGGAVSRLTADIPWDVAQVEVPAEGAAVAVTVNVDGRNELRWIDGAGGRPGATPRAGDGAAGAAEGSVISITAHPRRPDLALAVTSARGPSRIFSVDAATGRTEAWTEPARSAGLDISALPDQRIVRWTAFDGRTISGILSLPPALHTGPRPVVMLMHGGPESQATVGWRGRYNVLVQDFGVAVLEPNVRGSSGYGKTFLDLDNGRRREDSVRDMGRALDWIATQPNLDPRRVVVAGGSYGGYMALAASVRLADRIAGASSTVGISNFVSFLRNTESYRRDLRRVEYGDERDPAMREFLHSISPLTLADRITKPLLVMQGRNDPRVPWTESEQIVRNLQARGTPVSYVLAADEGHGFARRDNADHAFAVFVDFVLRTVGR